MPSCSPHLATRMQQSEKALSGHSFETSGGDIFR